MDTESTPPRLPLLDIGTVSVQVLGAPRDVTLTDGTPGVVRPIEWQELGTVTDVRFTSTREQGT